MISNNNRADSDDLEYPLSVAVQALHAEPVPEDAVERVKLRAKRIAETEKVTPRFANRWNSPAEERHFARSRWSGRLSWLPMRLAAAAVIAVMGYVAFVAMQSGSVAFAQVAAKIRAARALTFEVSVDPDGGKPSMRWKTLCLGSDRRRDEFPGGIVVIADIPAGKILSLNTEQRTAILATTKDSGGRAIEAGDGEASETLVEYLRRLADKRGEPLGKKVFAGIELQGFRVDEGGEECVVWADPATGNPQRIEMTIQLQGKLIPVVLDHFVLDAQLDESLFDLQPPVGYTVQSMELNDNRSAPSEKDVIALLRGYAERSDGRFPKTLDDWGDFAVLVSTKGVFDDESKQFLQTAGRVLVFLQMHKSDSGYAPQNVKLGDANAIVFWYRLEGAKKFRAIFGDLQIAEVSDDQLPTAANR